MSVFKELALAGPALVAALLISHAFLGPDDNERVKHSVTTSASWIGAGPAPAERWFAKESMTTGGPGIAADSAPAQRSFARYVTPHARIRGVFAQFVPGESSHAS